MKIASLFGHAGPVVSFEFFPPKTEEGVEHLYRTVEELRPCRPSFVSVTYGAGGSTRDRTLELVLKNFDTDAVEIKDGDPFPRPKHTVK